MAASSDSNKPKVLSRSNSSSSSKNSPGVPFYASPANKATPVEIIKETRNWLQTVNSKRPYTPRDDNRTLFNTGTGSNSRSNDSSQRPPSAFSISGKAFDESRPPSGTRLMPIDSTKSEAILPPKPPADKSTVTTKIRLKNSPIPKPPLVHSVSSDQISIQSRKTNRSSNVVTPSGDDSKGLKSKSPEHHNDSESYHYVQDEQKTPSLLKRKSSEPIARRDDGYLSSETRDNSSENSSSRGSSATTTAPNTILESGIEAILSASPTAGSWTRSHSGGSSTSRGGSGGRRHQVDDQNQEYDPNNYYDEHLAPIVDLLAVSTELTDLINLTNLLYQQLEKGNLLGKRCQQRAHVLKTVFHLLDRNDAKLHISLAKVILALKVSGNNLTNVCKLIYKVAKDKTNDQHFIDAKLSKLLTKTVTVDLTQSYEALVYLTGSLKFLTTNNSLAESLVKAGCIEALSHLQKEIASKNLESEKVNEQYAHIMVQVSGALRNLASVEDTREIFLNQGCIDSLVSCLAQYPNDYDLALNGARLLSKLSQHRDCCQALSTKIQFCSICRQFIFKFFSKEDLIVRLCFVLGNLTATCEDSRQSLFTDKSHLHGFLKVFEHYYKLGANQLSGQANASVDSGVGDTGSSSTLTGATKGNEKVDDVLIKMVRVLANSCISSHVGTIAANSKGCIAYLLNIIKTRSVAENEELLLNTISAINNITYYMDGETNPEILSRQLQITDSMVSVMFEDHREALCRTIGVLGNLSRERGVRDLLVKRQIDRVLITLLDSRHSDTVYCTVGVLLNLMADSDRRSLLTRDAGIRKLYEVLRDCDGFDWQLAGLVCKTLWNYTEHIVTTEKALGDEVLAQQFVDLLSDLTDDSIVTSHYENEDNSDADVFQMEMWKSEFIPVARKLLSRFECHQSQFEPL